MACGRQKVKGGNGSIIASITASIIASITLQGESPEPRSGLCPELLADLRPAIPPLARRGALPAMPRSDSWIGLRLRRRGGQKLGRNLGAKSWGDPLEWHSFFWTQLPLS